MGVEISSNSVGSTTYPTEEFSENVHLDRYHQLTQRLVYVQSLISKHKRFEITKY
jgi:hypothetical protein